MDKSFKKSKDHVHRRGTRKPSSRSTTGQRTPLFKQRQSSFDDDISKSPGPFSDKKENHFKKSGTTPSSRGLENVGFKSRSFNTERGPNTASAFSKHKGSRNMAGARPKENKYVTRTIEVMSLDKLFELQQKPPETVLLALLGSNSGFEILIRRESLETVYMESILKLVVIALSARNMRSHTSCLLQMINTSLFVTSHISKYLSAQIVSLEKSFESAGHVMIILQHLLQHMPSSSLSVVTLALSLLKVIVERDEVEATDPIRKQLQILEQIYASTAEQRRTGVMKLEGNVDYAEDKLRPPNNFRNVPIIPTSQELFQEEKPFLRKNKVEGGYESVEHYLDVQFRLLREDFVSPLRDGIQTYIQIKRENKGTLRGLTDVRVYSGVHIQMPVITRTGSVYCVSFDAKPLHRVRWENSKRLIFGSLVCLSSDNFKTLAFGTVAERDPTELKDGKIFIKFDESSNSALSLDCSIEYEMVESATYFEAYKYNLEGLQEIKEGDLPFQNYLLHLETQVDPPRYIRGNNTSYNFGSLMGNKTMGTIFKILDLKAWPTATQLRLDDSQYKALQTALTKEFAIIQGPPGTGKTFLGLKIMQVLLENTTVWNRGNNCPILVVCYTNHALDQFLEGTLEQCKLCTSQLLRIGGRSKSEILAECNLRQHYDKRRVDERAQQIREEMDYIKTTVEMQMKQVFSVQNCILNESWLEGVICVDHYDSLLQKKTSNKSVMHSWLLTKGGVLSLHEIHDETEAVDGAQEAYEEELAEEDIAQIKFERQVDEEENISSMHRLTMDKLASKTHEGAANMEDDEEPDVAFQEQRSKKKDKKEKATIKYHLVTRQYDIMSDSEEKMVKDPWKICSEARWRLYKLWLTRLVADHYSRIWILSQKYNILALQLRELYDLADYEIIAGASVIGMTTTGAAKYRQILQRVQPRIIIVEEAAEVFEAHIVTTLSANCQHLILIGDHQQLRPSTSAYKLAKNFHLDVSLFERMVRNSSHCDKLLVQHRMRPDIVKLIVPHIYRDLRNHPDVEHYENVKGVLGNIFFIEHHEKESPVDDLKSRSNQHEAAYLVALARYFIQQGYESSQITVLTTYTGQMFLIKRLMKDDRIFDTDSVRVTPVDNFQGEENDIVLLSLVRSNQDGQIGFLKVSNRVCVALSRARMGFYAIGNMSLLEESSSLWKEISEDLKNNGQIVDALPLACQNHPTRKIMAKVSRDFSQAPDGGCLEKCQFRLPCGHACVRLCHPYDPKHEKYQCEKPCTKTLCDSNHKCPRMCYKECPKKCMVRVEKTIPVCGHTQLVPCSTEPSDFACKVPCTRRLSCGHECKMFCGEECTTECEEPVKIKKPCGHQFDIECHLDSIKVLCPFPVEKTLPCNHSALVECSVAVENVKCRAIVQISCSKRHVNKVECHYSKDAKCYQSTKKVCSRNHKYSTRCWDSDKAVCRKPCLSTLPCGHKCQGQCGECSKINQHSRCNSPCNERLPCGHMCSGKCGTVCPPCSEKCMRMCGHAPCKHDCGFTACRPCRQPCNWNCKHHRCARLCSEPCQRPVCNKPCREKLKCGHYCIGLCGEECPSYCTICHANRFEMIERRLKISLKTIDRFVLLQPCCHVVEVKYMDEYMRQPAVDEEQPELLRPLTCPMCGDLIHACNRYNTMLKQNALDIAKVKEAVREKHLRNAGIENLPTVLQNFLYTSCSGKHAIEIPKEIHGICGVIRLYSVCTVSNASLIAKLKGEKPPANNTHAVDLDELKKLLEDASKSQDHDGAKILLPKLMLVYLQCNVRHFLTYIKNPRLITLLEGANYRIERILKGNETGLSCTEMYKTFCHLNKMMRENFDLRRTGVQCFLQRVANCFKHQDLTTQKWLKCHRGHIYSISKNLDKDNAPCPECHPVEEKHAHTWLDDFHDELEVLMEYEPEERIPVVRNAHRGRGWPRRAGRRGNFMRQMAQLGHRDDDILHDD